MAIRCLLRQGRTAAAHLCDPVIKRLQIHLPHVRFLGSKPTIGGPGTAEAMKHRRASCRPSAVLWPEGAAKGWLPRYTGTIPGSCTQRIHSFDNLPNIHQLMCSGGLDLTQVLGSRASTANRQQEWLAPTCNRLSNHEAYRYLLCLVSQCPPLKAD